MHLFFYKLATKMFYFLFINYSLFVNILSEYFSRSDGDDSSARH